jgi:hypothetical protein
VSIFRQRLHRRSLHTFVQRTRQRPAEATQPIRASGGIPAR